MIETQEREELERYRKIFAGAPIGLLWLDLEGRVRQANSTMEQLLGYSEAELGCLGVADITHPQDLGRCVSLFGEIVEGVRDSYDIEKRYVRKDGQLLWARARATVLERDEAGLPLLCIMMIEDIAERKRGELALRRNDELLELVESLRQFRKIFDGVATGLVRLDRDGRIVEANPAFARMVGYSLRELEGTPFDSIARTDPPRPPEAASQQIAVCGGEFDSERRYLRRDGEPIWCHIKVTTADRDESGEPLSFVMMVEDVSEQKAAEEQLRQAQKIEAIGQLAAGIAHDFNNLLMGVVGYAGLARGEVEEGTRLSGYLDRIEAASQRGAKLTAQLLAFGRRQTLQVQDLDLNSFVSETLTLLTRVLGERITITPALEDDLPRLRVDPTQIQQVLLNLTLNARDAMPTGGQLTITTSKTTFAENELPHSLDLAAGTYLTLAVSDTGCGIEADILERIFDPFFTTKAVGQGSGLGLASVHGIVKQSRGDIEVETQTGTGTTIRIYLPTSADQESPDTADGSRPR